MSDTPYSRSYWRHEIAKAAMAALIVGEGNIAAQSIAEQAVDYADDLLAKLLDTEPPATIESSSDFNI